MTTNPMDTAFSNHRKNLRDQFSSLNNECRHLENELREQDEKFRQLENTKRERRLVMLELRMMDALQEMVEMVEKSNEC